MAFVAVELSEHKAAITMTPDTKIRVSKPSDNSIFSSCVCKFDSFKCAIISANLWFII